MNWYTVKDIAFGYKPIGQDQVFSKDGTEYQAPNQHYGFILNDAFTFSIQEDQVVPGWQGEVNFKSMPNYLFESWSQRKNLG